MIEYTDTIGFKFPKSKRKEEPVLCCVCADGKKTLLNRNGKRICRDCYSKYLAELAIHG